MQKITVSLEDRHVYELEARQRLGDADSRSAAVRDFIGEYADLKAKYEDLHTGRDDLRDRLEAREQRIDELEEQLAKRSQLEQKVDDLPDKIREGENEPAPPWPIRWYQYFTRGEDYRDRGN